MTSNLVSGGFFSRVASLPGVVTIFVGIVAANLALVAFGNMTDYGSNFAFVSHVLSMDTTFEGNALMYRAITDGWLHHAAYIFLIALETIAAVLLIVGFVLLARSVLFGGSGAARGRKLSSLGLILGIIIFAMGFMTIGGEWFAMWQSGIWNGLEAAQRNVILIAIPLILLHLPSKDWDTVEAR